MIVDQHEWEKPDSPPSVRRGRYLEELWVQLQARGRDPDTAPAFFLVTTGFSLDVSGLGAPDRPENVSRHLGRCLWSCAYDFELVPECGDFHSDLFTYAQHAVGGSAIEDQHSGVLHWRAPKANPNAPGAPTLVFLFLRKIKPTPRRTPAHPRARNAPAAIGTAWRSSPSATCSRRRSATMRSR